MKRTILFLTICSIILTSCQSQIPAHIIQTQQQSESAAGIQTQQVWEYTRQLLYMCSMSGQDFTTFTCMDESNQYADIGDFLNRKGSEGWELVDIVDRSIVYILIYKRPK